MVKLVQPPGDERVINKALGIGWANWDFPAHLAYSDHCCTNRTPATVLCPG